MLEFREKEGLYERVGFCGKKGQWGRGLSGFRRRE
jgi:hypothetical protein